MDTPYRHLKLDQVRLLIGDGYEIVDVREDWQWKGGHIPGARHVVLASILAKPDLHRFREPTIFNCEVGERSAIAADMAVALGVHDVVNFRCGMKAWGEAGLPIEKPDP
jgi:hydroxyacylglutathione hydrolase